jgi:Domain of unknown function (DUF1877)
MSMIGNLLRVSKLELEQYLEHSTLLEERVYPEEYVEDPDLLDLDKAWESIYFLLTGCTSSDCENAKPPLSVILFNGKILDEHQDMGYGPATYCSPEEVKEISNALPDVNMENIRSKFVSLKSKNAELYPFNPDNEDMFDYIFEYYSKMKAFYLIATKNDQAVISFIN